MAEINDFFDLQLDEDALRERQGDYVLIDQDVRLWWKRNRIGLAKISTRQHLAPDGATGTVYDTLFRVIADADPDCHLESLRLTLDFSATPQVTVRDMIPAMVLGREPLKIKSKTVKGLSFEVASLKLGPSVSYEQYMESSVYVPEIRGLGIGFNKAVWTFEHLPGASLYAINKDLQLLLSAPSGLSKLPMRGTLRVEIARKGWTRLLPLIGYKTTNISLPEHSLENKIEDSERNVIYTINQNSKDQIESVQETMNFDWEWFWSEIAKDIEETYKNGKPPSEWSESDIDLFLQEMGIVLNTYCDHDLKKKNLCREPVTAVSNSAFYKIFKDKNNKYNNKGQKITKHKFAIYLGYDSYETYYRRKKGMTINL